MTSVPSGDLFGRPKRVKKTTKDGKASLAARAYNVVAGRPLSDPINRMQVYTVHGRVDNSFITSSATVPTFGAYSFSIANIANSAIYLACFDQYRFDEIEIWIEPTQGAASVPTNVGILATTIDLDDANTPSSFGVVESSQSAIVSSSMAGHYHKWQPHMAVAVYSGAFTSFANAPADWIDSGSPNVQHYGIKGAISGTTSVSLWQFQARVKLSFRQTV